MCIWLLYWNASPKVQGNETGLFNSASSDPKVVLGTWYSRCLINICILDGWVGGCMPILTLARSYGRHPGGFAIWPALLKAPRKISLLSTHIYWCYRLIYYCYHITFGLEHFLSFNTSLNSLWEFFSLLSVLENSLTVAHLSWYPPLIDFPLKL